MPKTAAAAGRAARAVSILLVVSCAASGPAAAATVSKDHSEILRAVPGPMGGAAPSARGTTRASCPPRWPYIVLTCTA
ncbi:hypothetical protein Mpop_3219 [Methylorubrum populi BJ001]|jgi:hypothetical protein|uniref:Uncharacterized protein n=1 Tax=Methylorubrum populi (strain ATCC BAA-705 / NCIMB 13946 / BJ001) TaxID=441620 RepID=B1ZHQ2_METPB|nr:hypothetical protein [Methylorubrum populi]ACB81370.1 hypothetical protein Mpop_3219 [Methylorubrum populi BJ001]OAH34600.1 hypothetical protein AX289_02790 [Methylorubrum populi]PZP72375.1 MAG: hypothetical protein DI590_02215 [Methylorubrum populi]